MLTPASSLASSGAEPPHRRNQESGGEQCQQSTGRSYRWANEGHLIVCEIALRRLSPSARAFVDNVRALNTEIKDGFDDCQSNSCSPPHPSDARDLSFLDGCIWADESRRDTFKGTYEYHFINVPRAATGFDLVRDCGMFDCVLVGIQRFSQ